MRSTTSLVQTIGRAARNADGKVILYADAVTPSMQAAMEETQRRRTIQMAYNTAHGITPTSIHKAVRSTLAITTKVKGGEADFMSPEEKAERIVLLTEQMRQAARELEFEQAAKLRDQIRVLNGEAAAEERSKPKPGTVGSQKRSRGRTRK